LLSIFERLFRAARGLVKDGAGPTQTKAMTGLAFRLSQLAERTLPRG
jgi:hypothetical protein